MTLSTVAACRVLRVLGCQLSGFPTSLVGSLLSCQLSGLQDILSYQNNVLPACRLVNNICMVWCFITGTKSQGTVNPSNKKMTKIFISLIWFTFYLFFLSNILSCLSNTHFLTHPTLLICSLSYLLPNPFLYVSVTHKKENYLNWFHCINVFLI